MGDKGWRMRDRKRQDEGGGIKGGGCRMEAAGGRVWGRGAVRIWRML